MVEKGMPKKALDPFTLTFCSNTKWFREETRRSQKDVAKILGVEPTTYKKWENHVPMPHVYIKRFVSLCNITIDDLFSDERRPPNEIARREIRLRASNKN